MNMRTLSMPKTAWFLPALTAAFLSLPAHGATLINVSGPNDASTVFDVLSSNLGVGFATAAPLSNVTIKVGLTSFFAPGGIGDWNLQAHLTTQVGPGTDPLTHEVAADSRLISIPGSNLFPPYTVTEYTVFSGLSLSAGTYYLTLSGTFQTANVSWASSPNGSQNVFTAGGASVVAPFLWAAIPDPYLPASSFSTTTNHLWFTVTGDLEGSPVPEPQTLYLCLGALTALSLLRRARARHN